MRQSRRTIEAISYFENEQPINDGDSGGETDLR